MNNDTKLSRRSLIQSATTTAGLLAMTPAAGLLGAPRKNSGDSLAMQLYKSLSDEQKQKICLPADHLRRLDLLRVLLDEKFAQTESNIADSLRQLGATLRAD